MKAVQLPYSREPAKKVGAKRFLKQLLPVGSLDTKKYGHMEFGGDLFKDLIAEFKAGAFDTVPFLLANEAGGHHDDPERMRGEVTDLEARDDGLYGVIEVDDRGADLIERHPKLPVSVRYHPPGEMGPKAVLGHVLATLDPVVKGMKPWQAIEASADTEVVDLSAETFHPSDQRPVIPDTEQGRSGGNMPETETPTLTKEDAGWLDRLRAAFKQDPPKEGEPEPGKTPPAKTPEEEAAEAEAQRVLDEILTPSEPGKEGEPEAGKEGEREAEPVAALSAEDRTAIDLATSRAQTAEKAAAAAQAELAKSRFERESLDMKLKGIPPADIELARPLLENGDPDAIELSNGSKVDAAKIVRELLKLREGTIEFSELGAAVADDDDVVAEQRRKDAEAAAEGYN